MGGRGPQTFQKRQKEQLRKEKQQHKREKRLERKRQGGLPEEDDQNISAELPPGEDSPEPVDAAPDA